jgi:hypothetical protein
VNVSLDLNALRADVANIAQRFAEKLPDLMQVSALDGFAKIRNRIQETGIDAKGSPLPPYSDEYHDRKAERYGEEAASKRNYTATGDMWRNGGITGIQQTEQGLAVEVAGETGFAQNKMDWNADRDGDFLNVSEQEEAQMTENLQDELDAFFATL